MDEFDQAFAQLKRSPFGEMDANDVFEQASNMPTVPTSGIEDIGFTPEQVGFIRSGVYNAGFRTPPPDPDSELDDLANKLPGWSYSKVGTVTADWVDDTSGGNVTFTAGGTTLNDLATIEQVIPVERLGNQGDVQVVRIRVTETSTTGFLTVLNAAYLDADGIVTGTAAEMVNAESGTTYSVEVVPNGEAGIPTTATLLRIRISAKVGAATVATDTVALREVSIVQRMSPAGLIGYCEVVANDDAFPNDGLVDNRDLATTQVVVVTAIDSASRNIHGILSTGAIEGRVLWIYNNDADGHTLVLKNESASAASSAYRIKTPNEADLTIRKFGGVQLMYFGLPNTTQRRWRVMSQV